MRVTADNIAALTAAPEFSGAARIIPAISALAEKTAAALSRASGFLAGEKFLDMTRRLPRGFSVAPVYVVPVAPDQQKRVLREYKQQVLSRFFRSVAQMHGETLRAQGFCDTAVSLMLDGEKPRDRAGRPYAVTVDHIVSRAGGGNWSLKEDKDPGQPDGSADKFLVNHFCNLVLLPDRVHEFKNAFEAMQQPARHLGLQEGWMLTIAPVPPLPVAPGYAKTGG